MLSPFLAPVLCLVLLTMLVWLTLFLRRIPYMQKNNINPQDLDTPNKKHQILPDKIEQPAHNLANLFEMPILFYVLCLIMMQLNIQSELLVGLAWGFVITRVMHSVIHCTYNNVMHRFSIYVVSSLMLWGMIPIIAAKFWL